MAIDRQDDTIKKLEKSSEGTVLALGAIADVLNKMELRFKKQEEDEDAEAAAAEAMAEEEEEEVEKASLVKEIASSVIKQLMDLQGDKPVEVDKKYKWPMEESDSDDAVEAKPRTATNEVQRPIQAMRLKKHDEEEEEEEAVEMAYKDHHEEDIEEEMAEEMEEEIEAQDDDVEVDYPMDEEEEVEDDEVIEEMRLMRKQMQSLRKMNQKLQKQLDGVGNSFQSATDKKADALMQKMGYRKEQSTAPRLSNPQIIAPADVPIVKGNQSGSADVADQLSDLSWSEVWNLRLQKMSGETDGLPKELLG